MLLVAAGNMLPVSRQHVSLCIQQQTDNKLATILLPTTCCLLSTPERLRGEVLTTRRYTNLRLPLPLPISITFDLRYPHAHSHVRLLPPKVASNEFSSTITSNNEPFISLVVRITDAPIFFNILKQHLLLHLDTRLFLVLSPSHHITRRHGCHGCLKLLNICLILLIHIPYQPMNLSSAQTLTSWQRVGRYYDNSLPA